DMMVAQLERPVSAGASDTRHAMTDKPMASIPHADPRALPSSESLADGEALPGVSSIAKAADKAVHSPLAAARHNSAPLIALAEKSPPLISQPMTAAANDMRLGVLPEHVSAFLEKMAPAARNASRATGLSEQLILAQAALETGWGQYEVQSGDGQPSYNAFNIKAIGWSG